MIDSLGLVVSVIAMKGVTIAPGRILKRSPNKPLGYAGWLLGMVFGVAPVVLVSNGIVFSKTGVNAPISGASNVRADPNLSWWLGRADNISLSSVTSGKVVPD